MARGLYDHVDIFRREVDHCLQTTDDLLDFNLKEILFPAPAQFHSAEKKFSQTIAALPALFSIEYSLAKVMEELGVESYGMLGHSVSEYVAACLVGVFYIETALQIVVKRAELAQGIPEGAMLAVALSEKDAKQYVTDRISLAATLAQNQCVVSGYLDSMKELEDHLRGKGVECKRVRVSRAFHSMMLDPLLEEFETFLISMEMNPPKIPFISGITGQWIDKEEVQTADYWVHQFRYPVRLFEGISEVVKLQGQHLLRSVRERC